MIQKLPEGYSEGIFNNRKYGITRKSFNDGKSYKVYGEELGGRDYVSLNYYKTKSHDFLKPCEMPEQKVLYFLNNVVVTN